MSYSPVNPAVGRRHAKLLKPTNIVTARVKLITASAATLLHLLQHVPDVKIMRAPPPPGDFTTSAQFCGECLTSQTRWRREMDLNRRDLHFAATVRT
jgi:hypothetical protein